MILGTFYEVKNPHPPQWVLWKGALAIGRGTAAALAIVSRATRPPAAGARKRKLEKEIESQGLFPTCAKEKRRRKVKETEWLLHPRLGFIRVCEALCCNPRLRNRALRASERQRKRQRETESCKYCSSDGESGGDAKQSGEGRGRSSSLLHVAYP
jgi:hypothetical protein